jgi:rhodanese-related sulfurtransferase
MRKWLRPAWPVPFTFRWVRELPRDREVVVMCLAGGRSLRVANFLAAEGFQPVTNLTGGITAWAAEIGL